jgi:hypothetical protein
MRVYLARFAHPITPQAAGAGVAGGLSTVVDLDMDDHSASEHPAPVQSV